MSSQWPTVESLPAPSGCSAAVQRRPQRGRDAGQRPDPPEAQAAEHGQLQAALRLGDVDERVGVLVAVRGRVGQRARAGGVEDDDEGAAAQAPAPGSRRRSDRTSGATTSRPTRAACAGSTTASTTSSAPNA